MLQYDKAWHKNCICIFMMKKIIFFLITFFSFSLMGNPKEAVLDLKSLVNHALKNNFEIKAKEKEIEAIFYEPQIVKSLQDPEISLEMMNIRKDSFNLQSLDSGINVSFTQRISNLQKRNFLKKNKEIEGEIELKNLRIIKEKVIFEVKESYFELYYLNGLLKLLRDEEEAIQNSIEVSKKKYESGNGILPDILRGMVEIEQIKKRRIEIETLQQSYIEKLKFLLGFDDNSSFDILFDELPFPQLPQYEQLVKLIYNTPSVNYLKIKEKKADNYIFISKLEYKPELIIKTTFRYRDMNMRYKDYFSLMAGVTLPIFNKKNKYDRMIEEAISLKGSSINELQNGILKVKYELLKSWQEAKKAKESHNILIDSILIQMDTLVDTAFASYIAEKVDFQYLIDSLTKYFYFKEEVIRTKIDFFESLSKIDQLMGNNTEDDGYEN